MPWLRCRVFSFSKSNYRQAEEKKARLTYPWCKEGNTLIVAGTRRAALSIIVPWFVSPSSSSVHGQGNRNGHGAWQRLVPFRRSNLTHLSRPSSSMYCQAQARPSFLSSFLSSSLKKPFYLSPPSRSHTFISFFLPSTCLPFFVSSRLVSSICGLFIFASYTPLFFPRLRHLIPLLMSGYFLLVTLFTTKNYFSSSRSLFPRYPYLLFTFYQHFQSMFLLFLTER